MWPVAAAFHAGVEFSCWDIPKSQSPASALDHSCPSGTGTPEQGPRGLVAFCWKARGFTDLLPTPHRLSLCRYLKEFRTEQCPLFVQHKCTQHRPYTCFHWHFVNQRRRRSIRRRDGTFNYSPDVYCTKYDEATGLCPEGDE